MLVKAKKNMLTLGTQIEDPVYRKFLDERKMAKRPNFI